jgi:hypothetical protein
LAKVEDNSVIRGRYGQKNAWYFVAARGTGMHLIAMVVVPYVPDTQTSQPSVFFHYFKRLEIFPKLATSSSPNHA